MRSSTASLSVCRAGWSSRYFSTGTRSPCCQRRRWSRRSNSSTCREGPRGGPGGCEEGGGRREVSLMVFVVQPQLPGDAVQGAGQPLAQGHRVPAQLCGDGGPVGALVAQLGQLPLLRGEPAVHLLEQVLGGHLPARTVRVRDQVPGVVGDRAEAA